MRNADRRAGPARGRALRDRRGPAAQRDRPRVAQGHGDGGSFLDRPSLQRLPLARPRQNGGSLHNLRDGHTDHNRRDRLPRPRRRRAHASLRGDRDPRRGRAPALARAALPSGDRESARDVHHRRTPAQRGDRARDTGRAAHVILALKLVLTPALIAVATLVGRRFGPSISGWLVGLPFTSGPVSLFLALEQGTGFAAAAAAGSIGGVAAPAGFAGAYAVMGGMVALPAPLARPRFAVRLPCDPAHPLALR